jgi:hypothetical protein
MTLSLAIVHDPGIETFDSRPPHHVDHVAVI